MMSNDFCSYCVNTTAVGKTARGRHMLGVGEGVGDGEGEIKADEENTSDKDELERPIDC
jgi:hypothetical protein